MKTLIYSSPQDASASFYADPRIWYLGPSLDAHTLKGCCCRQEIWLKLVYTSNNRASYGFLIKVTETKFFMLHGVSPWHAMFAPWRWSCVHQVPQKQASCAWVSHLTGSLPPSCFAHALDLLMVSRQVSFLCSDSCQAGSVAQNFLHIIVASGTSPC